MQIDTITIYPVKALAGVARNSAVITEKGLQYDRCFMLIDASGKFITQRTHPQLTAFSVDVVDDRIQIGHPASKPVDFSAKPPENVSMNAVIWNDTVRVSTVANEIDQFFSDILGDFIRLVGMPSHSHRQVDLNYARTGDDVSFADGYPILLLGNASIEELNSRLDSPVPLNRFRANIGFTGAGAWAEDTWKSVKIGQTDLQLVKPCARCIVIRTDQKTGERHEEPMATLLTYRRIDKKVMVGMNCIPSGSAIGAEIRVGQGLTSD